MNELIRRDSSDQVRPFEKRILRIGDLSTSASTRFRFLPHQDVQNDLAREMHVISIAKLRIHGEIWSVSPDEWQLQGQVGATVTQECVISLGNVRTRIDSTVRRRFLADRARVFPGLECRVPDDDTVEPLGEEVDLLELAREVMLLELPTYPRLENAITPAHHTAEPRQSGEPEIERPFAVLSEFRDRLAQ